MYVGLRAGLTVSASIPIAVLSISILRAFGRATILENNIVQTTGNAGQSVASGVIFTLPALIFLGFQLEVARIFLLSLVGGLIGVFFMIPLRRQLIVKEHGVLTYPVGTACADVLVAGDRGGSFAGRVFWGLGLGALYTFFQNENLLAAWPSTPTWDIKQYAGASIRANTTSEYMGVGYVIGPLLSKLLVYLSGTAATFVAAGVLAIVALIVIAMRLDANEREVEEEAAAGSQSSAFTVFWRVKTSCLATFSYGYFQAAAEHSRTRQQRAERALREQHQAPAHPR